MDYETERFPTPGSATVTQELEQLNRVLAVAIGKNDIVVTGNEPFIETTPSRSGEPLNTRISPPGYLLKNVSFEVFLTSSIPLLSPRGAPCRYDAGIIHHYPSRMRRTSSALLPSFF